MLTRRVGGILAVCNCFACGFPPRSIVILVATFPALVPLMSAPSVAPWGGQVSKARNGVDAVSSDLSNNAQVDFLTSFCAPEG